MRAGIAVVVALAAAAAGCKSFTRTLGFEEKTAQDLSSWNSKAGDAVVNEGTVKIKVARFETDFKTAPGSVKVELLNEGSPQEFIAFDVEFGYPAPPEAIAPYVPEFVEVPFENFEAGKTQSKTVPSTANSKVPPLFARVVSVSGTDVRRTAARETSSAGLRRGTQYLGGRVEVVKVDGNLAPAEGTKASMAFTLESQSDADVGNLRYMVQFFGPDGKALDLGRSFRSFKPAPKALGKKGDQVTVEVSLDPVAGLSTAKPVLRVIQ